MKANKSVGVMLGALLALGAVAGPAWSATFVDGTITVTPVGLVDLALTPNTYAFGNLNVASSSNSATPVKRTVIVCAL